MRARTELVFGVALLLAIGLAGRTVASVVPFLNYLVATIFVGLVVGNAVGVPTRAERGVRTHKLWLESGIVVMGATVAAESVVAAGPLLLALVFGTVVFVALSVEVLARCCFDVSEKTGSLLAAGSSICGVSAVVAVAGGIDADERQVAYAAGTVLLFDALTLLVYPALGGLLGLSDRVFGLWAGLTMFSTGPVTAAGFAFSKTAGEWAVLAKLARNALVGVAALAYALYYVRRSGESNRPIAGEERYLWRTFPKFVLGFFVLLLLAAVGVVGDEQVTSLEHASNWLFLLAFAGLGLELRLDELRSTGLEPVGVVLVSLVVASAGVLVLLTVLF